MKSIRVAMIAVLMAGSLKPDPQEVREALPEASTVQIKMPDGSRAVSTVGELAKFYQFTRGVSGMLNGGAAFVLIMVRFIVIHPPTSVDGETFVWGPWTDALNPA